MNWREGLVGDKEVGLNFLLKSWKKMEFQA